MADNADQIAEWNGPLGENWAAQQIEFDKIVAPFGEAALKAAAARPGEKVIDVGCGCGETSMALADAVGAKGDVIGVDISKPMLHVARHRAPNTPHLNFAEADASSAPLPPGRDLIFSRFGVMFFDDPPAAFAHMRKSLKPGGRLAFVCWRMSKENPWATVPVQTARAALKIEAPPSDPHAPGPFAFGDAVRTKGILATAGFTGVEIKPFDSVMLLGPDPRAAAEAAATRGPLSRLVRELGKERLPEIITAVEPALRQYQRPEGVAPPAAAWIVTARA